MNDLCLMQFLHTPSMSDLIIVAVIGLLLFGKRLPEVGRSLGKGIVEFKKGLAGIEDEIEKASEKPSTERALPASPAATEPKVVKDSHEAERVETHSAP